MCVFVVLRPFKLFLKKILPLRNFLWIEKKAVFVVSKMAVWMVLYGTVKNSIKYKLFDYPVITNVFKRYFYPDILCIFLTTRCNLRCFICRREDFTGEDMDFENIYKLEKQIKYSYYIDLTGWGECFLYPRFEEILQYIYSINKKKRIIQIISNGTLLSENIGNLLKGRLNYFAISLNAATAETYNRDMKYGDFEKTIANIKSFMSGLDADDRKLIILHFVAHVDNYLEIPEFVRLANGLEIGHVTIGNYLIGTTEHLEKGLFNIKDDYNNKVSEAQKIAHGLGVDFIARQFYSETPTSEQKCTEPYRAIFIHPDGEIPSPCCYAGKYLMGNVFESSFDEVWFGKKYSMLRKKRHLAACQHCTPFVVIDDLHAHFDGHFKQRPDFDSIINGLGRD